MQNFSFFITIFLLSAFSSHAIIRQHDIPDEKYRLFGAHNLFNGVGQIEIGEDASEQFTCTATLLDERTLITAAHCLKGPQNLKKLLQGSKLGKFIGNQEPQSVSVVGGRVLDADWLKPSKNWPQILLSQDEKIYAPKNDVALLYLERPIELDSFLPVDSGDTSSFLGKRLAIVGYGESGTGENDVPEVEDESIKRAGHVKIQSIHINPQDLNLEVLVHEFTHNNDNNLASGIGDGDSGGPLISMDSGQIVGVLSAALRYFDSQNQSFFSPESIRYGQRTSYTRISGVSEFLKTGYAIQRVASKPEKNVAWSNTKHWNHFPSKTKTLGNAWAKDELGATPVFFHVDITGVVNVDSDATVDRITLKESKSRLAILSDIDLYAFNTVMSKGACIINGAYVTPGLHLEDVRLGGEGILILKSFSTGTDGKTILDESSPLHDLSNDRGEINLLSGDSESENARDLKTLTIDGNYRHGKNAKYVAGIDKDGSSSLLAVKGSVEIAGGKLVVDIDPAIFSKKRKLPKGSTLNTGDLLVANPRIAFMGSAMGGSASMGVLPLQIFENRQSSHESSKALETQAWTIIESDESLQGMFSEVQFSTTKKDYTFNVVYNENNVQIVMTPS